jgi:hypothetical protein
MPLLPDYGLAIKRSAVRPDFRSFFYTLQLNHISSMAPGQFTTMITVPLDGVDHALSLDFDADKLCQILMFASPRCVSQVQSWLLALRGVATIELDELVTFGASASLGEEQQAEKEHYIPLSVEEVFPA